MFKSELNQKKKEGKIVVLMSSIMALSIWLITIPMEVSNEYFNYLILTSLGIGLFGAYIGQWWINEGMKEEQIKLIKPFDFGDKLYFIEAQEKGRFQLFTGKVYKKREEIITDYKNKELKSFSYKLKDDKGNITDFINQKLLSSDSNDILSRLSILK